MGNFFSKCINKPFTLHTPPVTSEHLKKAVSDIQKNHVKYFATVIH